MVIGVTIPGKSTVFFNGKMGSVVGKISLCFASSSSSKEKSGTKSGSSSLDNGIKKFSNIRTQVNLANAINKSHLQLRQQRCGFLVKLVGGKTLAIV
jgi:hypothetical protein